MFQIYNPLTNKNVSVIPVLMRDGIAGYSKDGTKIYYDPTVPVWMMTPLVAHEVLEMVLMQQLEMSYEEAHRKATTLEREVCIGMNVQWEKYDETYRQLLGEIGKRDPKPPVPSDMDVHV